MKLYQPVLPVLAAAALVLAACDRPEPAATPAAPAAETAAAAPAIQPAPETDTEPTAAEAAAANEQATAVAETGGAADEEVKASGSGAIELKPAAGAAAATPVDWEYEEGTHFRRMTASQGTSSNPDKIEVAEVFWYGCSHCYNFDPIVEEWKASAGNDVSFVRIPVIWSPTHQEHARLMYTAESLGVLPEAHEAIFASFHQKGNLLAKEEDIVQLFAGLGVEEDKFREAYNSFGVTSAVKRAENLTRRYGIRSVPIVVVNGKYVTEGKGIKSFADMLNVTDELIERERRGL